MEISDQAAIDWSALAEVDEAARDRVFIGHNTPWESYTICYCVFFVLYTKWILITLCERLFDSAYSPSFRVMVCEFLSSFDFAPRHVDQSEEIDNPDDPWIEVAFRLAGVWHEISLREFVVHYGLYTMEETNTPNYTDGIHMAPRSTLCMF
ncbi:hypothetical protein Hanom_Chr09g00785161 [Helianthus anomalus]